METVNPKEEKKVKPEPEAFYPCLHDYCAEEVSYPADMLFWVEDGDLRGWMCEYCLSDHEWSEVVEPPKKWSLAQEIQKN